MSGRWRSELITYCSSGIYPKLVFDEDGLMSLEILPVLILLWTTNWGLMHPNSVSECDTLFASRGWANLSRYRSSKWSCCRSAR